MSNKFLTLMDRRWATGIAGKQSTILRISDTIQHLQPQSRRMKRLYKMESFYSLVVLHISKKHLAGRGLSICRQFNRWEKVQLCMYYKSLYYKSTWKKRSHIAIHFKSTSKLKYLKLSYTIQVPRLCYIFVYYN